MKRVIFDFLRGVATGMIYTGCFASIGIGIYLLLELHTTLPWIAIVAFLLASFLIIGALTLLTALGRSDRVMESKCNELEGANENGTMQ